MNKGICLLGAIPVRKSADNRSEMTTQLIWGELFTILEQTKNWVYIKSVFDQYEGWVSDNQIVILEDEKFDELKFLTDAKAGNLFSLLTDKITGKTFTIPAGSDLYNIKNGEFSIGRQTFKYDGSVINEFNVKNPSECAKLFLNTPYLWGGRTAMGIDCSGLTQIACKMAGINIKRDAHEQSEQGVLIHFHHEAKPGDLVFFDDNEGIITHVGIIVDSGFIIHAHGRVRIDSFDQQGIFNAEKKKYTHQLRLIKRML